MPKQNYIDRPPRLQPELPTGEYNIPTPPQFQDSGNQMLIQASLPIVTIIGYIVVASFGQSSNMLMMIPMGLSVVASTFLAIYTNQNNQKKRKATEAAYQQRISELHKEMQSYHEMQRIFYNYNYPNPEMTLEIAKDISRPSEERIEDSRGGSRLWERHPDDVDFARIRLGTGTLPSTVVYKLAQTNQFGDDKLIRDAARLAESSLYVTDVPVTIPLRQGQKDEVADPTEAAGKPKLVGPLADTTPRHAIGIAGNNPEAIYAYMRALLVDYTAFHSPTDARLYVVGTYEARPNWRWAFPLPHCKETTQEETLSFEEEKAGEATVDRVRLFWKKMRLLLERRKARMRDDKEASSDVTLPFILVVVDMLAPLGESSSLRDLESDPGVSLLLEEGPQLGAAIIFLVPERSKVPSACVAVLEVEADAKGEKPPVFRYAEVDINQPRYVGRADLVKSQDQARDFARIIEPLGIRRAYGADLATNVTLFEMNAITSIDQMTELTTASWERSKKSKFADWMGVNVGAMSGNEVRKLVFSAKADGVHGMIAGSTGSGKSELLMTLILGLAITYDPSIINFVLVDYKGGSAFEPFRNLPHAVDIVTNLEGSATDRMFASIKAELDRRQRLNTYSDSKDIVHYRKKGLHLVEGSPPYPHLFVIIDEFAEMISGNSEFKSQLESITRLGRSLGVTLILAAQRPTGVTDQMRANIKFRICLRVETPDDSRELLRRSDAAFLPPGIPGRGYLQVGNENIELIQVAHTGGDYLGPQENASPNVIWLDRPKKSDKVKTAEAPKLYEVVVQTLADLAKQNSKPQWRPWPAFLPRLLNLRSAVDPTYMSESDLGFLTGDVQVPAESDGKPSEQVLLNRAMNQWLNGTPGWPGIRWDRNAMRPVVGLIDDPYNARQMPLTINFPVGHMAVFGASGWGKTVFLRTVVLSLAATHSPDELQIYILDFGGRNLALLRDLPHVGAVITSDEDERVKRLVRLLAGMLEQRQTLLSQSGDSDLYTFNLKHPASPLPAILVVIDNFAELKENFDALLSDLIALVRDARAYGIHFAISGDQTNAMPAKMFSIITERYTLKLSDASEYTNIVGRGVRDVDPIAGRGYVRVGRMPLEFQTALPVGVDEEDRMKGIDESEKINRLAAKMTQVWGGAWKGTPPVSIETLPVRVPLEKALQMAGAPTGRRIQAAIGINDRDLQVFLLDLQRNGPHFVVLGPPNSGKTTTLRTILLAIASQYSPEDVKIVLADFQRRFFEYGGKHTLGELPQVVQVVQRAEQLENMVANLSAECKLLAASPGKTHIYMMADNYDSFSDEGSSKSRKSFDTMALLAREYGTAGLHFVVGGSLSAFSGVEDLRKQILSSSYGIALQSADAVDKLNGRMPRSLKDVELPAGRSFAIKSGRTAMLQLAVPYTSDDAVEPSLDAWVEKINATFAGQKAVWSQPTEAPGEVPAEAGGKDGGSGKPSPVSTEIEVLKAKLKQVGIPDEMMKTFAAQDVITMATQYGLLEKK